MSQESRLVRRREAAEHCFKNYGFGTEKSFAKMAHFGEGPPYRKAMGRFAIYDLKDVDEWAMAQMGEKIVRASDAK